jgi:hypothetical protein
MLSGVLWGAWLSWREVLARRQRRETLAPVVSSQPVNFAQRTFDPANPPTDMPPLYPGEEARCDSDFGSNAHVDGETTPTDATHANLTITKISVALRLNIIIWLPPGAPQRILEHEDGHRQISEYYYQIADQLAARIAGTYMGREIAISGPDLNAESTKALQQIATEITDEYNRELSAESAQLLFDAITDHGRNGVEVKEAVAHALKNASIESPQPASP